jgi:hypothetical protein
MSALDSLPTFVVTTLVAGTGVGAAVPLVYSVATSGLAGGMDGWAMTMAGLLLLYGAMLGLFLSGSAAAGAVTLGLLAGRPRWSWMRPIAPFVGAYLALMWVPFLTFMWWESFLFMLIPSVTVGVTAWLPWRGGFMNARAVAGVRQDQDATRLVGTVQAE